MSRLAKKPIKIPDQVRVKINKDRLEVKGPQGQNSLALPEEYGDFN